MEWFLEWNEHAIHFLTPGFLRRLDFTLLVLERPEEGPVASLPLHAVAAAAERPRFSGCAVFCSYGTS